MAAVLVGVPACGDDGRDLGPAGQPATATGAPTPSPPVTSAPAASGPIVAELVILGDRPESEIEAAVRHHGGTVVRVVPETATYVARFPVRTPAELAAVRDALVAEGLDAVVNATTGPLAG
jgi:hypothetical protein